MRSLLQATLRPSVPFTHLQANSSGFRSREWGGNTYNSSRPAQRHIAAPSGYMRGIAIHNEDDRAGHALEQPAKKLAELIAFSRLSGRNRVALGK